MPYIKEERRKELENGAIPMNAGELNFLFTMICRDYLEAHGETYQNFNDIIGALEGAKLELYRRKILPYENIKMSQNGDMY